MHTWQNNRLRESAENAKKPHWASVRTCSIAQKWFAPGGSVRNILPLRISNEPYWGLPTKKRVVTPFMGLAWAKREEEGAENAKSDASRFCGRRLDWLVACCQGRRSRKTEGWKCQKRAFERAKSRIKGSGIIKLERTKTSQPSIYQSFRRWQNRFVPVIPVVPVYFSASAKFQSTPYIYYN